MNERTAKEDIFKVLRLISAETGLSQRDVSKRLEVSLGKTNYMLRALAEKGLIKAKSFASGGGKMKKLSYVLTGEGFEEKARLTYHFLKKKEKEYLELKKELKEDPLALKVEAGDL